MRLRASLRLRNDVMLAARARLGLTQAEAAWLACIPVQYYRALESLRYADYKLRTMRSAARSAADALGLALEDVMPEELEGVSLESDRSETVVVSPGNLLAMVEQHGARMLACAPKDSDDLAFAEAAHEMADDVYGAGSPLTPREKRILRGRMEGRTFAALATAESLAPERARQIESKALDKARKWAKQKHTVMSPSTPIEDVGFSQPCLYAIRTLERTSGTAIRIAADLGRFRERDFWGIRHVGEMKLRQIKELALSCGVRIM